MTIGRLFLVSAPSGAGKTSLVQHTLRADDTLVVSVSHTTRARRSNEQDGVNYHFIDHDRFQAMIAAGEFLEHAQVFDQFYGTAKAEVHKHQAAGKDVILEIDWQGADQVRQLIPEAIGIFILPPSINHLKQRLIDRGENSANSIARRLADARLEMAQAPRYDYLIVNDDFVTAAEDLAAIFRAERSRCATQMAHNADIRSLLSAH